MARIAARILGLAPGGAAAAERQRHHGGLGEAEQAAVVRTRSSVRREVGG